MAIGTQSDITMHSGDTRVITVTVVDSSSAAVNLSGLTGAQITWALSKKASDSVAPRGAAIVTKIAGSGIAFVTNGTDGKVDVMLASGDTEALAGEYYHELQITISAAVFTVLYGKLTIAKDLI